MRFRARENDAWRRGCGHTSRSFSIFFLFEFFFCLCSSALRGEEGTLAGERRDRRPLDVRHKEVDDLYPERCLLEAPMELLTGRDY